MRKPKILRWFCPKRRLDIGPNRQATTGCNGQQASSMTASLSASSVRSRRANLATARGQRAGLPRAMIALDCAGDQVDLFFTGGVDDEINETALNLRPFVAHFVRQAVRIFLECLMQHTDEKKTTLRYATPLRQVAGGRRCRNRLGQRLRETYPFRR